MWMIFLSVNLFNYIAKMPYFHVEKLFSSNSRFKMTYNVYTTITAYLRKKCITPNIFCILVSISIACKVVNTAKLC